MSYRLTDVTALPHSSNALLTLVHPSSAVDIVGSILNPYTSAGGKIENLDPNARRSDVLDRLADGELVLIDSNGTSPGIFRSLQASADTLLPNLPPRLTRALDDHWNGRSMGGGSGPPIRSDNLAPPIEQDYQPPSRRAQTSTETGQRTLDLLYRWPDGSGVAGTPYLIDGLNRQWEGRLDSNGQAHVTGLTDPVVNVRFGEPAAAGELDILRRQFQAQLDGILARERREAAALDETTGNLPLVYNAGVHFANGFMGLWDSAVGMVTTALAVGNLNPLAYYNRAVQSAWMATLDGSDQAWIDDFKQRFDEKNKRALVSALGFDPDSITREQLVEAYEITSLLLADLESREILGKFAVDFAQAQDSTEISYFAGGLLFEVVLGIVLAAATGGTSAALSAPRYLRKLQPLAEPLRRLAARLKITRQTRYHYSVETNGVCESNCRPRPHGPELKTRTLVSRRLFVNSLEQAKAALAASRRRLIARGGFTPKYSQEELVQLANGGLDSDRFIFRFLEDHHVDGYKQPPGSMNGTLGRPGPTGEVRYWSTTLDQIEPSDTDPKLIAQQLGVDYNPEATYRLAIIDKEMVTQKAGARTLIPTFDNLKIFLRESVDGYANKRGILDEILTPAYQAVYRSLIEKMPDAGWDSLQVRSIFLRKQGLDDSAIELFESRFDVQMQTGANQHFLGNGLTKHTELSGEGEDIFGAIETFTLEKNPQTFREMTHGGNGGPDAYVELVDLVPIKFGE
ncbi:hypothetical protein [Marinobacter mobilis]|uniref:hypothetical protein n=1 Tax=Marinobacter mobilis TaxID=488533 RepID=UPI0035C73B31